MRLYTPDPVTPTQGDAEHPVRVGGILLERLMNTMHTTATNQTDCVETQSRITAATWLWISAAVLVGLLLLQLSGPATSSRTVSYADGGERGTPAASEFTRSWSLDPLLASTAYADVVAKVGDQTLLTFNGGSDDILALLDSRSEQILTYRVRNQTNLELIGVYNLPELFIAGQRLGTGTGGGRGR